MDIQEIQRQNCEQMIPTKWNIYEWCEKHPLTTIAAAVKRVEKIMDLVDGGCLQFSFSGGKDSTLSANLACLELNLRRLRVNYCIMRDGSSGIDPLDLKWYGKRLYGMMTDAEVCFTDTNQYSQRFLARMGPEGTYDLGVDGENLNKHGFIRLDGQRTAAAVTDVYRSVQNGETPVRVLDDGTKIALNDKNCKHAGGFDLIEFSWFCLPLAWQSGVSFNSGVLISWDPDEPDMWVQPMPDKVTLHGFQPISVDSISTANAVQMETLSLEAQRFHMKHDHVFQCKVSDLFNGFEDDDTLVRAVGNYGRGNLLPNFKKGCHEKEQQDDHSYTFSQTAWLRMSNDDIITKQECNQRIAELYDLTKDVWHMEPAKVDDKDAPEYASTIVSAALVSLRAEESLDRRVILSQGEYSTGQYSNNQGTNICSPVFDLSTSDVWRLLSATDWDVNDIYNKLYEIGVGIGDQRVGSLLNYAAVRQVSTVKALEPDLYSRINGRFQNVEFMAQFSRAGYYKISRPRDTHWDGKNHIKAGVPLDELSKLSDQYQEILNQLQIPYSRKGNEFWTEDPACKGKPWYPLKVVLERNNQLDKETLKTLAQFDHIHISWKDYSLMLLNSTSNNCGLRDIWHEKFMTSYDHWLSKDGSISEANLFGLELLSVLPEGLTKLVVDDYYGLTGKFAWSKLGRLNGSKRMRVHLCSYPQESLSNEAFLCLQWIVKHKDEEIPKEWMQELEFMGHDVNKVKDDWNGKMIALLHVIPEIECFWNLGVMSNGASISQDEVLTYLLEKPLQDADLGSWMLAAVDVAVNGIPSQQWQKWWKSDKIEGFPLNLDKGMDDCQKSDLLGYLADATNGECLMPDRWVNCKMFLKSYRSDLSFDEQWALVEKFAQNGMLKEDVSYSPCFKKIAICVLKNDAQFKYAGFGATLREREAREQAMAAFSTQAEEKKKAREQAKETAAAMAAEAAAKQKERDA